MVFHKGRAGVPCRGVASPRKVDKDTTSSNSFPLETQHPFVGFRAGGYAAILADPPWRFQTRSPKGDDRAPPYTRMSVADIAALPVGELAARDAVLFLWTIDPMLPQALEVIGAWGFVFKTIGFTWVKMNATGVAPIGCGFWTRANPEQCLLATRGHPKRLNCNVRQLIMAPRREHSRKPDEIRARIERLVAGPYVELFARERAPGWDAWGDEIGAFGTPRNSRANGALNAAVRPAQWATAGNVT
jgi:N6-adenosine-specific RNA methylase IME4